MLQRIQSLFLLGIALCMAALFFLPAFGFGIDSGNFDYYLLNLSGPAFIHQALQYALLILVVGILMLALVTIFCYKKRRLQIKLCFLNIAFIVLFYIGIVFFKLIAEQNQAGFCLQITTLLPAAALIFNYLAVRYIKKDEALIRSMDRIR